MRRICLLLGLLGLQVSLSGCLSTVLMVGGEIGAEVERRRERAALSECLATGRHGYHLPDDSSTGRIEFLSCTSREMECAIEDLGPEEIEQFRVLLQPEAWVASHRFLARTSRRVYDLCAPLRLDPPGLLLRGELEKAGVAATDQAIDETLHICAERFEMLSSDETAVSRVWTDGEMLFRDGRPVALPEDELRDLVLRRLREGCSLRGPARYSGARPDRLDFREPDALPYVVDNNHAFSRYWTIGGDFFFEGCRLEPEGTLRLVDYRFAVDEKNVYFDGWKVPGADPATFEVTAQPRTFYSETAGQDHRRTYASSRDRHGLLCDGELCVVAQGCEAMR